MPVPIDRVTRMPFIELSVLTIGRTPETMVDAHKRLSAEEIEARLGVSTMIFGDRRLGQEELRMIREAGIRNIELAANMPEHFDYADSRQIELVSRACEELGIKVVSVHAPDDAYPSFDEKGRRAGVETQKLVMDALEPQLFVVHLRLGSEEQRNATQESIVEILDYCSDSALKMIIECGEKEYETVDDTFVEFTNSFSEDQVGMAICVGDARDSDGINPFAKEGVAYKAMAKPAERLIHLHLHDWNPPHFEHLPPYDGCLLWQEMFQALHDIDYRGTFMFEIDSVHADGLQKLRDFPERYEAELGTAR